MTAKRLAELEIENRMLREQVASLERVLARAVTPVQVPSYVQPSPPYWTPTVTCGGTLTTSGPPNASAGGFSISGGGASAPDIS